LTRDKLGRYDGLPPNKKLFKYGLTSQLSENPRWKYPSNITKVATGVEKYHQFQHAMARKRESMRKQQEVEAARHRRWERAQQKKKAIEKYKRMQAARGAHKKALQGLEG
jgi:hypothetical protein